MEYLSPVSWLFAISEGHLGLHGVAQLGGILGVILAVDQHQWMPLVVLDDVGDTAEMLKKNEDWQNYNGFLNIRENFN